MNKNPFRPKRTRVQTSFLELIGALIDGAKNDAEIIASVTRIFERFQVRTVDSLAPLRLVVSDSPHQSGSHRQSS